ncbi:type II secretion system F family protein [Ectobacillus ponti]|uniref:Type II secretion system F family protein n=1 Tax=Ectobacillus ponti TaxID=2961894 RepID=A0AA42BQJ0_9BACI|nr:type II secretion system F family protein [Ectobacillus ponti]MCP8968499.1 type II secretion system F family protein [Ectobacillus ponti]
MPQFQYTVRTKTGKKETAKIIAASKREAYEKLRDRQLRVLEVTEAAETWWNKEIAIGSPLKLKDFVVYLRQFSALLKAGITVVEATRILAAQTESKVLRRTLEGIEDDLRSGHTLSGAYSAHKRLFSRMFISMVRAGETSGQLDEAVERMADYYEKQMRIRQKISSAMAYPAAVGIIAVAVVIFLLTRVVPTFVAMFKQNNTELPAITKFVMSSSDWMVSYWWIFVILLLFLYIVHLFVVRHKGSKYYWDYAILNMPLIGALWSKSMIAQLTRTLGSLIASSVPILQALAIVEDTVNNEAAARSLQRARESLQNGLPLSQPLKEDKLFPPLVSNMIAVGEETGSLDAMLAKIADFYEAEVDSAADTFKSLIEPVMVVFLAAVVGTIVLAIMVPLFKLYNSIN